MDPFTEFAAGLFKAAPEAVTSEQRKTAKMIAMGIAYGMSTDKLEAAVVAASGGNEPSEADRNEWPGLGMMLPALGGKVYFLHPHSRAKTPHQARIEEFMTQAGQSVPDSPCIPDQATLQLRARLILEEALETIEAMGYSVIIEPVAAGSAMLTTYRTHTDAHHLTLQQEVPRDVLDIVEIMDGLADLSVVTIGSFSSFGVADESVLLMVDDNNNAKFGPGHTVVDGKLVKPPTHEPPKLHLVLEQQAADAMPAAVSKIINQ